MFLFLSAGCVLAQPAQKLVRSGNKAYKDGHFKEAEIDYRKALTKAPNSQKATFNLGNSLYKQQNYEQAAALRTGEDAEDELGLDELAYPEYEPARAVNE